jgi:hypothetical protein
MGKPISISRPGVSECQTLYQPTRSIKIPDTVSADAEYQIPETVSADLEYQNIRHCINRPGISKYQTLY